MAARGRAAEHLVGLQGTALAMRVATLSEDPVAIAAYPVVTRGAREARQTRYRAARTPDAAWPLPASGGDPAHPGVKKATMSRAQDLWHRRDRNRTSGYGKGRRWQAIRTDGTRAEQSRAFTTEDAAVAWAHTVERPAAAALLTIAEWART